MSVVTLTDAAVNKVGELLDAETEPAGGGEFALRIAVRPGGCSGFSYEMFFDADREEGDTVQHFERPSGAPVVVVVDPTSAQLLDGATLAYRDGLHQSGFSIENPNASRTCGCGQSFS